MLQLYKLIDKNKFMTIYDRLHDNLPYQNEQSGVEGFRWSDLSTTVTTAAEIVSLSVSRVL